MKKLITMIGAAAAAFGLYAETVDLEESTIDFSEATPGVFEFGEDEDAGVTLWHLSGDAEGTIETEETRGNYLKLDAEAPVYRTFAPITGNADIPMDEVAIEVEDEESARGGIIVDQLVKFSAFEDDPAELGDAKIAVWVKTVQEEDGDTPAVNHLMISTAALDSDVFSPTLTNIDTEVVVDVANWHQLKITAIQAATVSDGVSALPVPGFVVELDGKVIAKADGLFPAVEGIYTAQGAARIAASELFPSMIAYSEAYAGTLQGVAFKGTGAIDDITVTAADPYTPPTTGVAAIGETGYLTIEAAIEAVENGQTIKLLADLTATVIVPAGKNFTLDFNGFGLTTDWGIKNSGTLTIVNGKINTRESSVVLYGDSVTTIESGTFTATDNAVITGQGLEQNKNVTLTINGGTFNGGITTAGYIACGVYVANSGTYTINGGTFNITNGCGICARAGQVTVADEATFNVEGSITGKVGDKNVAIPCVDMYNDYSEPPYPGYAGTDFLKAEDNTLTIAEGFEWAGPAGGLYTLQAKSTEVDPTVINPKDIPADTKVSAIFKKVPSAFADVDASKFATWCQKEGNKSLVGEGGADALLDAFLLDCLNSDEEIEKAKKAFVIVSITQDANGDWIVLVTGETGQGEEYGNGYVNIIPATEIPAVEDVSAFFKAVLTIAPVNQD